ncbi:hypothetical protein [uncultured Desulfuromonas sp.]|uniref:hypothetical protein n=1 Tax=uncultured Desulfuromonas sp. TaxID=181013 RepID=UPI002605CB9E|nr:hypothetical protein [uncultured Desulfuromonas sp.]
MKKGFLGTLLLFFLGAGLSHAGPFGPLSSDLAPGQIDLGTGYFHVSADWEGASRDFSDIKLNQNQLYLQMGIGLGRHWEATVRGGVADWQMENAYVLENGDSDNSLLPYGTVTLKGPLFIGKALEIGSFFQGSYFSLYDDSATAVAQDSQTGTLITGREKVFFDNLWEFNIGLAFQIELEGAYLYGGPFYHMAETDVRNVFSASGFSSEKLREETLEEENNMGVVLGIRWPLRNGLNIDLEGQYKSSVSIGTAVSYAF